MSYSQVYHAVAVNKYNVENIKRTAMAAWDSKVDKALCNNVICHLIEDFEVPLITVH